MSLHILVNKASRDFYHLDHPFSKEINDNIKKLEKKELDQLPSGKKCWKLDAFNLYNLITLFKGRTDIFFEFVDPKEKPIFIEKYKKSAAKHQAKAEILSNILDKQKRGREIKAKLFSGEVLNFHYNKYLNEGVVPFTHQIIGALFINEMASSLIAADMGSGKTLMAILATIIEDKYKKVLVIVPNSLKFNWGNEIKKFTNEKYYILNEKKKSNNIYTPEESKYFIVNYEYFATKTFDFNNKIKKFGIEKPDRIIIDESHRLKNPKAQTTKNILEIFKEEVDSFILLSGTPAPSRLAELFTQLHVISPVEFTSKSKFYTEYCGMVYNPHSFNGWVETGKADLDKLYQKLDSLMFRVKKKDVLKNLPAIQVNKIYLTLTEQEEKEYKSIEDGLKTIDWNNPSVLFEKEEGSDDSVMGTIAKLRQFNSMIKIKNYVSDFITELNLEGNKVVTFDFFKAPLKQLTEEFKHNSEMYSGDIKEVSARQAIIDRFQEANDKLMNLFITTQSGNYGITLTRAHNMLVLNQSYVPGENEQTYARLHRPGQEYPVSIYVLIIKNTIDEDVDDLLTNKTKILSKVIDNEDYKDQSQKSVMKELMAKYKQRFGNSGLNN